MNLFRTCVFVSATILASTLQAYAHVPTGSINILTTPAGAKFYIFSEGNLSVEAEGVAPSYIANFPTGRYLICYQLAGHENIWSRVTVSTYRSSWADARMPQSNSPAIGSCEKDASEKRASKQAIYSRTVSAYNLPSLQYSAHSSFASPTARSDQSLPAYDSMSFCRKYSSGSYQIEETCIESEKEARGQLSKTVVPQEIMAFCDKYSSNSYQILLTCVENEKESKNKVR